MGKSIPQMTIDEHQLVNDFLEIHQTKNRERKRLQGAIEM